MSLCVVGSMAFDDIETPHGASGKIIGGAGTYIAWAAANFVKPVNMISVVGGDFPEEEMNALNKKGVDLEGVKVVEEGKSFYWSGKYHADMNTRDTLITELNVLDGFNPVVPEDYKQNDYLLLGNLDPKVQLDVINQMSERPKLIALDTMNFWMDSAMTQLKEAISCVDVLIINDSEARQLSGEQSLLKAAEEITKMGPQFQVIKKGEHGALLFHGEQVFFAPALPLEEVFDPTGAGDTFAGGFMGYLAQTDNTSFENMKVAIIKASVLASFCVEEFGTQRLREITDKDIQLRINSFIDLVKFDTHFETKKKLD